MHNINYLLYISKVPISYTKIKLRNKFLLLKTFIVNFEIQLNVLLFFIVHFIKLSAAILKRSWFVCLKILPVCLHLFPKCEYLVSEKIPEHGIQSEVLRDILLLTPKGQMTLKGIPREAEMNHSYFTFPRLYQLTLWASVLLNSSHSLQCTLHCFEYSCFVRSRRRREQVSELRDVPLQKQETDEFLQTALENKRVK